jgi:hypothetical protein
MRQVAVDFGGEHAVAVRGPKLRNASQKLGDDCDQLGWCEVHAETRPSDSVVCCRWVVIVINMSRGPPPVGISVAFPMPT